MAKQLLTELEFAETYREESVGIPLMTTVLILVLVAAPLVYWIWNINQEGTKSTDVSKYNMLVDVVSGNVRIVDAMLRNDAEELAGINAATGKETVTLIVPEVVIVEQDGTEKISQQPLQVTMDGIYWSTANPLVGIDGETYKVGDRIQGYEIVHIGKTAVRFKSADGTIVVVDMYENLLQPEE